MKLLRYFCTAALLLVMFLPAAQAVQPIDGYSSGGDVSVALYAVDAFANGQAFIHNDAPGGSIPAQLIVADTAPLRQISKAGDSVGRTVVAKNRQDRSGALIVYDS